MKSRGLLAALCLAAVGLLCRCSSGFLEAPSPGPRAADVAPASGKSELVVFESQGTRPARGSDAPRGGELLAKTGHRVIPLPLQHTEVKAWIIAGVGSVDVTQKYRNPYEGKIEAIYNFPLPEDAAVRDFILKIGDREIRGVIREREEALRIYLEARRQGYVASLLSQDRPNIFTQSVANIEPGKEIDVRITYLHNLRYVDGVHEFVFPMTVGPRYNPRGTLSGVGAVAIGERGASGQKTEIEYLAPAEITSHDVALEANVDAGAAIDEVSSPSHDVEIARPSPTRARVTLRPGDRIPNKDFILRYRVSGTGIKAGLATFRDKSGGYFALILEPPAAIEDLPSAPREMVFVVDVSGSMDGDPLEAARRALERCLSRLGPADSFQVIRFANTTAQLSPSPLPATPENVRLGLRHVRSLTAAGGTELLDGLRAALDPAPDPARARIVIFLTDGYIGNDDEVIAECRRRVGSARVFSVGVGTSPNRHFIEGLARAGRGVSAYLLLDESVERVSDLLSRKVERAALRGLSIDWGRAEASEVYPAPLPDLFAGSPVRVTGRFKGAGPAEIKIRGMAGIRPYEASIQVDLEDASQGREALGILWARAKIASLWGELGVSTDPAALADRIKETALRYGLASPFTSFLSVDALRRTGGDHGTTIRQPVPVPKGVKYETTVVPANRP